MRLPDESKRRGMRNAIAAAPVAFHRSSAPLSPANHLVNLCVHDPFEMIGDGRLNVDELLRQRFGQERRLVDSFEWGIELFGHLEIGRRTAGRGWPFIEPPGQLVGRFAVRAEPADDVLGRNGGEVTERSQAEAAEDVREVGLFEDGYR